MSKFFRTFAPWNSRKRANSGSHLQIFNINNHLKILNIMGMKLKAIERNVSFDKNKTRYAFVLTPELYGKLTADKVI